MGTIITSHQQPVNDTSDDGHCIRYLSNEENALKFEKSKLYFYICLFI